MQHTPESQAQHCDHFRPVHYSSCATRPKGVGSEGGSTSCEAPNEVAGPPASDRRTLQHYGCSSSSSSQAPIALHPCGTCWVLLWLVQVHMEPPHILLSSFNQTHQRNCLLSHHCTAANTAPNCDPIRSSPDSMENTPSAHILSHSPPVASFYSYSCPQRGSQCLASPTPKTCLSHV